MENEEYLKKINKELKVFINESTFISMKCRNKVLKMLGNAFSIKLPIENYKTIDVRITKTGSIIMRDEEYKAQQEYSEQEIIERYETFQKQASSLIDQKEINYYKINDKSNIVNIILLFLVVSIVVAIVIFAIKSFLNGNYYDCVWLIAIIPIFIVPTIKNRLEQAINFIKRKLKK